MVLTSPQRLFVDVRLLVPLDDVARDEGRLDWAFAGTSEHDGAAEPPHSVFRHWVDSRHLDAEAVRDEGDMVPSDAKGEVVETGDMVNPATGQLERYEECWLDGLAAGGQTQGWVLKHEAEDGGRGLLIRVGERVQGVVRIGGQIGVVQWEIAADGETRAIAEIGRAEAFPASGWERARPGEAIAAAQGSRWDCVESW